MKILRNGKEEDIKVLPLKGRHADKGFRLFVSLEEGDEVKPSKVIDYFYYLDTIAAELSGMTVEQLNDLDETEKQKIIGKIHEQITGKIDFLKSSLKSAESATAQRTDQP